MSMTEDRAARVIADHQPTTGMSVASGVTCRCGYWNGDEQPGVTRPVGLSGLMWHQAQMIAAAGLLAGEVVPDEEAQVDAIVAVIGESYLDDFEDMKDYARRLYLAGVRTSA